MVPGIATAAASRNDSVRPNTRRSEIRAHHVQRPVRQVHEVHDPEHERQPGRQQEEQHAELQAVAAPA
jgi:hypothetical protein